MYIKTTLRYPEEEILRLVELAASLSKAYLGSTQLNIKNGACAYAGRAYSSVPSISNADPDAKYLVTIRIGEEWRFPKDNLVSSFTWEKHSYSVYKYRPKKNPGVWRGAGGLVKGKWKTWMEKRIETMHPYGGKSSPYMQYLTWQEALVAVAAHEFNHIHQYQHDLPRSEVECERAAFHALTVYRVSIDDSELKVA